MIHKFTHREGTDANNHMAVCTCGWKYASTYLAARARGKLHVTFFGNEYRAWDNPFRTTMMPSTWKIEGAME